MNLLNKFYAKRDKINLFVFFIALICFFITTSSMLINLIIHALAMVPFAYMLGDYVSQLSEYIGAKKGGLLTAALGNIPELIMGVWSIKLGLIDMVQAAMIGSVVNSMLFELGIAVFIGGIKYKHQRFNKNIVKTNFSMLLLAICSLIIMACIKYYSNIQFNKIVDISVTFSVILIIIYLLGLVFSIYTHSNIFTTSEEEEEVTSKISKNNIKNIVLLLFKIIGLTIIIYFLSEKLINNASDIISYYNVSQIFMGIILIPILGNVGETISSLTCSLKNKINLSLEIAIGSSLQIALFVTPMLVVIALFIGVQMALVFSILHIIIIILSIFMAYIVFADGNTYWFEGTILIAVYIIITICYFYV